MHIWLISARDKQFMRRICDDGNYLVNIVNLFVGQHVHLWDYLIKL